MANTAFDPLRSDPFTSVGLSSSNGELVPYTHNGTQPKNNIQLQPSPEDDILMQFANSSNTTTNGESQPSTPPKNNDIRTSRKQRVMRSPSGVASLSSLNSRSVKSDSTSNFAPPPEFPIHSADHYTSSYFHANAWEQPSVPPVYEKINHSGTCLARISTRTKMLKVWKQVFWIIYNDHELLVFKTKSIFEEWLMNPYLSRTARDALVKLRVNFQIRPSNFGYATSMMKRKHYSRMGMVYQFKLDKWYFSEGPSVLAAFGSQNDQDVEEMHLILKDLLRKSPVNCNTLGITNANDYMNQSGSVYSSTDSVRSAPTFARPQGQNSVSGANSVISGGRSLGSYHH